MDEMQQPEKKIIKMSDYTRREVGLVNNIQPARPQPPKKKKTKASKILKGQR